MAQPTLPVKNASGTPVTINTINPNGKALEADSQPVVLPDTQLAEIIDGIAEKPVANFFPSASQPGTLATALPMYVDETGSLITRGGVTTDEGSFRANFAGATYGRSIGSATFTNGSAVVTGSFSALDPMLQTGDYVKLDADAEAAWAQIESLDDGSTLTLSSAYTGTGGTGASSRVPMKPTTGTGMTLAVSAGVLTIACNTTAAVSTIVARTMDYGPLFWQSTFSISQRIANQTIYRGMFQPSGARRYYAWFRFDGTTNTTVICETGWSDTAPATGTDQQASTVTLPNGLTSAVAADYRIEFRAETVTFYVNDVVLANHKVVAPKPYDILACGTHVINGTTPASNTNVAISYEMCNSIDSMRMFIASNNDAVLASNQPDPATTAYNVAGVITINTDLAIFDMSQWRCLQVQCISMGTTGVVTFYSTNDLAQIGTATGVYPVGGGSSLLSINAAGMWTIPKCGKFLRVRLTTATTAGTTTINMTPTQTPPVVQTISTLGTLATVSTVTTLSNTTQLTPGTGAANLGKAEDAVAASGDVGVFALGVRRDALTTSASAAADYNEIAVNRFGALYMAGFRTSARTYSASAAFVLAASATQVASLYGSASTTVQVTKIRISGIQTTAGATLVTLTRHSAVATGGTSSAMSIAQHESTDAAATATPLSYTVNPTPGASAGNLRQTYLNVGSSTTANSSEVVFELGENGKPVILSGVAQGISINLNGATLAGGTLAVSIEWIEF